MFEAITIAYTFTVNPEFCFGAFSADMPQGSPGPYRPRSLLMPADMQPEVWVAQELRRIGDEFNCLYQRVGQGVLSKQCLNNTVPSWFSTWYRTVPTRCHKPSSSPRSLLPQAQDPFSGNYLEYWRPCTTDISVLTTVQTGYSLQFKHGPTPFRSVTPTSVTEPQDVAVVSQEDIGGRNGRAAQNNHNEVQNEQNFMRWLAIVVRRLFQIYMRWH
ncbi:UNVERIFIED_CONTAM: hypothetical protein FKN15_026360 [Acipenser sinensis]